MKKIVLLAVWLGMALAARADSTDAQARGALLGAHKLALQWISWEQFGSAKITDEQGVLRIKGEQKKGDDYLTVDGTITAFDAKSFTFEGTIVTRISHIAEGKPCERKGKMTFAVAGKRKYWRLQEMKSPCSEVTDYVDVYFKK